MDYSNKEQNKETSYTLKLENGTSYDLIKAMHPNVNEVIEHLRKQVFPEDMSAHTLFAKSVNRMSIQGLKLWEAIFEKCYEEKENGENIVYLTLYNLIFKAGVGCEFLAYCEKRDAE